MAKTFVAESPLEKLAYAGKYDEVVELIRSMTALDRQKLRPEVARLVKISQAARFSYGDDTFAGWGKKPTDEQFRAIGAAALLCGTAKDAAEGLFDIDDVILLGNEFAPPALAQMPLEMMKTPAWRVQIHDVQRLIASGLAPRPDTDEYVLGLMLLFSHQGMDARDFDEQFAADPGLKQALLRIFEVEGVSDVSLAAVDKYAKGRTWSKRLLAMIERGIYTRELLIDKTLGTLERGWIQFRSGWFSQFHELLAPSVAEMKPHAHRYVGLLASRIPPTVTFALGAVKQLETAGVLEPLATLNAIRPVMSSAVKSQVENALKLIDRIVKGAPAVAAEATKIIIPALSHESAEVQKQILKRLETWKPDAATLASLQAYASGIAATNRDALTRVMDGSDVPAAPTHKAPPPLPAAAPQQAPPGPLDVSRRIVPIATLDELVERVAYVFENDTDIDEFERALAALIRFAPLTEDARKRFAPLAKRIDKVRKPVGRQLARMLDFLLTGNRAAVGLTVDHGGNTAQAQRHLFDRMDDLMEFATRAKGTMPLGVPTHRRGFIDAVELVGRLEAHRVAGVESSKADFLVALMRLAPERAEDALRHLALLAEDPFTQALRYALGEDTRVRDAQLAGAAKRMRAVFSGAATMPRAWTIENSTYGSGKTFTRLTVAPLVADEPVDPVMKIALAVGKLDVAVWYNFPTAGGIEEGVILYYASLLPADMETLFADAVGLLSRNIDWWQAQWENAAYLRQLLHPDVPMRPMATLALTLGLAGKEPGQTAIAVDALVQARAEGRLDQGLLAADIRECLRADHAACARYAKSLRAALRIDAAMASAVFDILCEAIAARPADPPKDTAALLELMVELAAGGGLVLPPPTRAVLESMEIGGKGKALRKELLARAT